MKLVRAIIALLAVAVLSLLPLLAEAATPILVEGAMECETDLLIKEPEIPVEERIGGWRYVSGEIQGIPVVISVTSIGMTNAVAATTLGIEHFHPKAVELMADSELLNAAVSEIENYKAGRVVVGKISSSNTWNRRWDRIRFLHKKYGSSCEEMEAYAAAHVCKIYNVPFISIRAISNAEIHGEEFNPVAGTVCQQYVLTVIKSYAKRNIAKSSP